jgi:general secretion pathway protein E
VRFRVDGVLRDVVEPNRALAPLLVSRIKVMARLDIAEKRIPQDGRVSVRVGGHEIDVRVSTIPTQHGERVVLRLLDRGSVELDLATLGMQARDLALFERLLERPHGMLLVTGPTGSGKTTTLYAALAKLNDRRRNILTVEDPIEYELAGIGQTQVNARTDHELRARAARDPAAGSGRDHGGRDPRPRDGGSGRARGDDGAFHALDACTPIRRSDR